MLSKQQSITLDERHARNETHSTLRQLRKEHRRNSQLGLDILDTIESPGSLASSTSSVVSQGTIGDASTSPQVSTAKASADDECTSDTELARGLSRSSQEHVEQRLGAFEQISLISTLLVGTAAGALLVVDREKVGEYQCGLDQIPDDVINRSDSLQIQAREVARLCDATETPPAVWLAVIPLHVTIGLNLFVTLVFVLVAFYTKRTMGW